ncbi:MAG: diacylglycerol kinase family lipid kinase [Thermoleophilia bacterium]
MIGVVANPTKSLGPGLRALRAVLGRRGVEPLWRETGSAEDVPEAVKEQIAAGVDLLFVWGGDGMVQECIAGLAGTPATLALLPAGTANLLAANLGIPTDLEAAVEIGLSGDTRRIDIGVVNGEPFAVMAGTGFDAILMRDVDTGLKDRLGPLAYVAVGVRSVTHDPVHTSVAVDGAAWFSGLASCVLVGNVGHLIAGMTAFPNALPDDGVLDVGVITAEGALEWARMLSRTVLGDPASSPFVETTTGRSVTVSLAHAMPYEVDGDTRPAVRRLNIVVRPAALAVRVPRGAGAVHS